MFIIIFIPEDFACYNVNHYLFGYLSICWAVFAEFEFLSLFFPFIDRIMEMEIAFDVLAFDMETVLWGFEIETVGLVSFTEYAVINRAIGTARNALPHPSFALYPGE